MGTLFDPVRRTKEGIRWGLVAYTTAAFSFVTIFTATNLHRQSVSFIDDRKYSDYNDASPGPVAYQSAICAKLVYVVPIIMFMLNNWLADGVLVSYAPNLVVQASDVPALSFIVATLFTP